MTEYKKVTPGTYNCFLACIKCGTTKSGKPRVSIAFKVADSGEFKDCFIWDNITCANQIGFDIAAKKFNILTNGNAVATGELIGAVINTPGFDSYAQNIKTLVGTRKITIDLKNVDGFDKVYIQKAGN